MKEQQLRDALEPLEWMYLGGVRQECLPMCPECGGTRDPHPTMAWTKTKPMQGHKPGCKIAIALDRPMPNHEDR